MSPAHGSPDPDAALSLRLEADLTICSDDHGATWTRPGRPAELLAAVRAPGWELADPATPTAASLAMLAEARNSRPADDAPEPDRTRQRLQPAVHARGSAAVRVADTLPSRPLARVLSERRSRRSLDGAAPLPAVGSLLARVLTTSGFDETASRPRAFAPLPSAGGRRSVRVALLALRVDGMPHDTLWGFDPNASVLRPVDATPADVLGLARAAAAAGNLHGPPAALLLLLADFARTTSRYPAGAALVWRDAGVVLGGLCVGAQDVGLPACPLGTSGAVPGALAADCYTATGSLPYDAVHDVGMVALGGHAPPPAG